MKVLSVPDGVQSSLTNGLFRSTLEGRAILTPDGPAVEGLGRGRIAALDEDELKFNTELPVYESTWLHCAGRSLRPTHRFHDVDPVGIVAVFHHDLTASVQI